MPGIGGIVFGVIVAVWAVWVFGREEQQREAARKKALDEDKAPLHDT